MTLRPAGTISQPARIVASFAASLTLSIHACAWRVITFMVRPPYVNRRYMWLTLGGTPGSTIRNTITAPPPARSEEHTSELQSRENLVCRLLLEKKKIEGIERSV